jgi:hypothetical protein
MVVVLRAVRVFVNETCAPGMTACCGSLTTPLMPPVCAKTGAAITRERTNTDTLERIDISQPPATTAIFCRT